MKILTKEEEAAHYRETLKGGTLGGFLGLGVGFAGVVLASRRYHFFRTLTLPLKAFLVTSSGTFTGIIGADHYSRKFEQQRNPLDREYAERRESQREAAAAGKTLTQRATEFARAERYKIVGGSWILSMVAAFSLVNRNKYLTGQQKIVQARVYAQFLTLGVLVASAAFEIHDSKNQKGRYETVKYIDPTDPDHKRVLEKQVEVTGGFGGVKEDRSNRDMWKDMIKAEEDRLRERSEDEKRWRRESEKKAHQHAGASGGGGKKNGAKPQDKGEKKDQERSSSDDDEQHNDDKTK